MEKKDKKLNGFNIFTMVYGGTIGSGIFLLIGYAIEGAGRSLPLAVLLGAVYVTLTCMYSYVISSFVPLRGGVYDHIAFIGLPLFTGVQGLSGIFGAAMLGSFGQGVMDYVSAIFPVLEPFRNIGAVILVVGFFAIAAAGTDVAAKAQNIMTVVLIASLLIFAFVGIGNVDFSTYFSGEDFFLGGGKGFIAAAALMAFACQGGESTGFGLASQTKNPTRTIPVFTLLGVFGAVLTYVLMCIVAAGVLPVEDVANQPLTVVAEAIFSRPMFALFCIGGAAFALLSSLMAYITYLRYPCEAMADDGWLPAFFNKKLSNGYPYVYMIICVLIALIPMIFNISFDDIVAFTGIAALPLMCYANFACISLPKKYPKLWKKSVFHMPYPLYVGLMVLSGCAALYYAWSYMADYDWGFRITAIIVTIALYVVCWLRVKSGAVDVTEMRKKQEDLAAEIAAYDAEA